MGPLKGVRVLEMAGLGPGPFCAMMLADMGAEVLRIERPGAARPFALDPRLDLLRRGRPAIALDLKKSEGVEAVLALCTGADALIEGFRPGVMEKLGLGPDACLGRNPRLVYGRMTGWGQDGPLAPRAAHDIDYIALTGALDAIGEAGRNPPPPLNLVADFGGGGMLLAFGVLCALLETRESGQGQVVDAAMIDGVAAMMTTFYGLHAMGLWSGGRGGNLLDGGAHFYGTYETRDGKYVAIGAIEPQFYAELIAGAGLDADKFVDQFDAARWPEMKAALGAAIKTRTRDEWAALFADSDACVAPVLTFLEAPGHPHHQARGTYAEIGGVVQPAPAPRFSRTAPDLPEPPREVGEGADDALAAWGMTRDEIAALRAAGALG